MRETDSPTPLTTAQVIERLLQSAGGQIVVCNIVAGIENRLIDPRWATEVLAWMGTLGADESYADPARFVQALDRLRMHLHSPAASLPSALPDIRLGGIDAPAPFEVEVSCILPAYVVGNMMLSRDQRRRAREGLADPISSIDFGTRAAVEEWQSKPARARMVQFDPAVRLGHQHSVVWFTRRDALEDALASDDTRSRAQRARDLLGLVHRQQGDMLAAMHFSPLTLSECVSARPTFADAGSHVRFKTWPDSQAARNQRSWGRTVDLHALGTSRSSVDGCPERTTKSIDGTAFSNDAIFELELLGAVEASSGQGDSTDVDFARKLLNGRPVTELGETLKALAQASFTASG